MQSYLGEYPGSRAQSDKKFIRAIESFINQSNTDSELIVVSDGCELTHKIYHELYKPNPRIKYAYIDKDTPNMYEGDIKYYRGLPREVGRAMVSGEITTYMDSDDYLIQNHCHELSGLWDKVYNKYDVMLNQSWYDNMVASSNFYDNKFNIVNENITIDQLESKWLHVKMNKAYYSSAPWLLSHKSDVTTKWRDVFGVNKSEDVDYNSRLKNDKYRLMVHSNPIYVRCHYSNKWDY